MPEEQIPPVVAVVVAHDPGGWFEEGLASVVAQDYPGLVVLVVDAASPEPLAARVAAVDPSIYYQRVEDNRGFGPSANAVLGLVEGAGYFLVCHDDVVLAPDAVRRMVEESFRSNAAVVGPKLVDCTEPDLILQFGLGVDRLGAPIRRVGHREFDQSQHDETREVFAVPGAATLVRADLFATLGGFDPEISMLGEDVDLCWRARLAGARVVVTPFAQVRHREATASRQRPLPDARSLQRRHEIRGVLKNYERARRVLRVAELFVLSMAEVCYFLAVGHRRRAREVLEAWRWNFAASQRLGERRRELRRLRRLTDRQATELMTGGTSRFSRYLRPGLEQLSLRWSTNADALAHWAEARRARGGDVPSRALRYVALVAVAALVFGCRSLIVSRLPLVGGYLPLPTTTALVGHFFAGSTYAQTQAAGPVTPALLLLGAAGILLAGAMGVLLKLLLLAAVALGALGVVRLATPLGPPVARTAAVVAYLYLPLVWNDVALGDVRALAAYGVTPYLLARLMRASGLAPFDRTHATPVRSRAALGEMVGLGLLLTIAGAFEPALLIMTPLAAVGLTAGSAVLSRRAIGLRGLAVGCGGTVIAWVGLLPWSLTFVQGGVNLGPLTGAAPTPSLAPNLSQLLRLDLGPYGSGALAWGLVAGAAYVLCAGRRLRFQWAVRLWSLGLWCVALCWLAGQGFLGPGGGASRTLVAPFAVCIALLVGLGVATVVEDLREATFGLSQLGAVVFLAAIVIGSLPILGATLNGRFDTPTVGYRTLLSWIAPGGGDRTAVRADQRILWLGNPAALPLGAWQIDPGLAYGLTEGQLPDATAIWPSLHVGNAAGIAGDLRAAEAGSTVSLGSLLARDAVRYIVVPTSVAPELAGTQHAAAAPAPQLLLDALANQTDLHQLPSEGGALVFEDTLPPRSLPQENSGTARLVHLLGVLLECAFVLLCARTGLRDRRRRLSERRRARAAPSPVPEAAPAEPEPVGSPV